MKQMEFFGKKGKNEKEDKVLNEALSLDELKEKHPGLYKDILETPDGSTDILRDEFDEKAMDRLINLMDTSGYLVERDKDVIRMYYGINPGNVAYPLEEIAKKYSLSTERVRQLKDRALLFFRKQMRHNPDLDQTYRDILSK